MRGRWKQWAVGKQGHHLAVKMIPGWLLEQKGTFERPSRTQRNLNSSGENGEREWYGKNRLQDLVVWVVRSKDIFECVGTRLL